MPRKHDLPKRQADRKSPWGGSNLVWSLVALGVAGLFGMSLLATPPELELSYSELEKLIRASQPRPTASQAKEPAPAGQGVEAPPASRGSDDQSASSEAEPAGFIEVVERNPFETGPEARRTVRYGDLDDVVIGAYSVTGSVRRLDGPSSGVLGDAVQRRHFRAAKLPSENSEGRLSRLLAEHGVPYRYEEAPGPWRSWLVAS